MSEIVNAHIPCQHCGSSDGATEYTDHIYCFVCEKWTKIGERSVNNTKMFKKKLKIIPTIEMEYKALKARGITQATCKKYQYFITKDEFGKSIQVACYFDATGSIVFQKTRDADKNFIVRGKSTHIFWGQQLFQGGKKLVITEGEIDCLTVSQVQGNKYPVVSIPFGAKSAVATFKENLEWLEGFEEVIVMFDMDAAGQKATQEIGGLLSPHKLKVAKLPLKDPNECLLAGQADAIITAVWNAKEYHPDGIKAAKDLKSKLFEDKADLESFAFPWCDKLTAMTRGMRKREMLLLTAGSGIGKSTMAREIAYKLKMTDGLKVGLMMLEESPTKTLRDILSIHMQKPLHLMWDSLDKKELSIQYDEVFGDDNFILYDHFGSIESNNLLQKIRFMAVGEGCNFIILDHISIAVSGLENNDERRCIDQLMTALRSLVEETGIGLIIVCHLRKTDNKATGFEEGGIISLDDLRGSGTLKQLPDTVIGLERNQQSDNEAEKNELKLRVLKCRFTGNTGLAGRVVFNKKKNIIEEIDDLEVQQETPVATRPF